MIKIFNKKTGKAILIDESHNGVTFAPRDYHDDYPHVEIQLHSLNFHHHAHTCEDCAALIKAFGTNTRDWYIEFMGKTKLLDLTSFSSNYNDNTSRFSSSSHFYGTTLKLNLSTDTIESLSHQLEKEIVEENYEKCCDIRDAINAMKENENL